MTMTAEPQASKNTATAPPAPSGLLPVEEARARILAAVGPLATECVPLREAVGRAIAEDVVALLSHPPAPMSAMDGYALRAEDAADLPVRLRRIGTSRAGERFHGALEAGTCVRIFTGGVVPDGADTIALQEDTSVNGDIVAITEVARPGQHIRRAGLDFAAGEVCVPAPHILTPRDIGVIASCGLADVPVRRRPRVAILSTGDELVEIGVTPAPDQIVCSNGIALAATVRAWGGEATDLGIVSDNVEAIAAAVGRARDHHDMLVTTGGASVGDHDLAQESLRKHGFVPSFWQIAMRPGKPLMFGKIGTLPVMGLPGNPVSALVCARLFLRPAMLRMLAFDDVAPAFEKARLETGMPANDKREDYVRARLSFDAAGHPVVRPFRVQDSSMLRTLVQANALIRRPSFASPADAGEEVDVLRLDGSS